MLPGITNVLRGSNIGATKQLDEPKHAGNNGGRSVWYKWTAPLSETVHLNTFGTSFDTLLAVYTNSPDGTLAQIIYNDDWQPPFRWESAVLFDAKAGRQYLIAVDGYNPTLSVRDGTTAMATNTLNAQCGAFVLNAWRGELPPSFFSQPTNQVLVLPGNLFSFRASASQLGGGQWYKDGAPLLGASYYSYTIPKATETDAGVYQYLVTNSVGSARSEEVRVSVLPLFFSKHPQSVDSGYGYSISFTGQVASLAPVQYQWQRNQVPMAGETNSVLRLSRVEEKDAGIYALVASNELGVATSSNAVLSVVPYTFATLAGSPGRANSVDGTGPKALLYDPRCVAVDDQGTVYFTEWPGHTVRRVSPEGKVTTVAGTFLARGTNDGPAATARFNWPEGIAVDGAGTLYVLDNYGYTVRKITAEGMVSTIAGVPNQRGWRDGPAASALFGGPTAITRDHAGNLYIAEWAHNSVRRLTPDGFVTTVVGLKGRLDSPTGIGISPTGDYWVTTQAGPIVPVGTNGVAQKSPARVGDAYGGAFDPDGNYWVGGSIARNQPVYRISPNGRLATIAGTKDAGGTVNGAGSAARFERSLGIAIDANRNVYIADGNACTIRKGVPFAVTRLPRDTAVAAGQNVTLDAEVASLGVYHYQWLFEDAPLLEETNATLNIGPVTRTNSGLYSLQISNDFGNSIVFYATVRALVPSVLEKLELSQGANTVTLHSRDSDGALPYDPRYLQVEWRTNLPSGTDQVWIPLISRFTTTNGFILLQDTNPAVGPSRFYRIRQY